MALTDKSARLTAIAIVAVAAIAIFGTGLARLLRPRVDHLDPDRSLYPVKGIDVSAHNGCIDFGRAAADSISFVYIKASEGEGFADAAFADNHSRAREAGLAVGAYHFFRFDSEGWRQAANMLRTLANRHVDLPLAIDVEEWANSEPGSTAEVVEQLTSMRDYLRAWGYRVVFYSNKAGHLRFLRGRFPDDELWICSFTDPPLHNADWRFWQHSHRGTVDGLPGPVDLNTFCGDSAAWRAYLRRGAYL